jgi:hypothetical protein
MLFEGAFIRLDEDQKRISMAGRKNILKGIKKARRLTGNPVKRLA